jgi:hypothetical protein
MFKRRMLNRPDDIQVEDLESEDQVSVSDISQNISPLASPQRNRVNFNKERKKTDLFKVKEWEIETKEVQQVNPVEDTPIVIPQQEIP